MHIVDVYHILGVMSGSSLDALDLALVRFEVKENSIAHWKLLHTHSEPLSEEWRTQLAHLTDADPHTLFGADANWQIDWFTVKPD
jgi:anhydro-N-acetylmuramic acid kinase